ncbi:3-oxoacyl-ACP synthase, partial [Acinetobacter baumannii]
MATNTPDALFPNTAALVQARFGIQGFAYDLLAGCPGWLYALAQAHAMVEASLARKVLVVGAEAL